MWSSPNGDSQNCHISKVCPYSKHHVSEFREISCVYWVQISTWRQSECSSSLVFRIHTPSYSFILHLVLVTCLVFQLWIHNLSTYLSQIKMKSGEKNDWNHTSQLRNLIFLRGNWAGLFSASTFRPQWNQKDWHGVPTCERKLLVLMPCVYNCLGLMWNF